MHLLTPRQIRSMVASVAKTQARAAVALACCLALFYLVVVRTWSALPSSSEALSSSSPVCSNAPRDPRSWLSPMPMIATALVPVRLRRGARPLQLEQQLPVHFALYHVPSGSRELTRQTYYLQTLDCHEACILVCRTCIDWGTYSNCCCSPRLQCQLCATVPVETVASFLNFFMKNS